MSLVLRVRVNIIVKAFQSQNLVKTAVRGTGCQWHLQWQAARLPLGAQLQAGQCCRGLGRVGLGVWLARRQRRQ